MHVDLWRRDRLWYLELPWCWLQFVMIDTVLLSGNSDLPNGGQLNGDELPGDSEAALQPVLQTRPESASLGRGPAGPPPGSCA